MILTNLKRRLIGEEKFWRTMGVEIGNGFQTVGTVDFGSEPFLVTLGNDVKFSINCKCFTHDGGVHVLRNLGYDNKKVDLLGEILLGNNIFIGANSTILLGVIIGNNVIVGANSLVTKSIPDNQVWAGNPAKFICSLSDYELKNKKYFMDTKYLNYQDKKGKILSSREKLKKKIICKDFIDIN